MRILALALTVALGCAATSREATAVPRVPAQLISIPGCDTCGVLVPAYRSAGPAEPAEPPPSATPDEPQEMLRAAIPQAAPGPRRVLEAMQTMLDQGVVVRGSCNRWVQEVFRRAGGRSRTVFSASRTANFTDTARLRPGDWIHFINHSYEGVSHSAVFVGWSNEAERVAMTASYPGQNRDAPGRYRDYDFSNVYRIVRMDDTVTAPATRARRR